MPDDLSPLPDPYRRNIFWFTFQLLMQAVLGLFLNLRVRGLRRLPKTGGAMLLINHQCNFDPLIVGLPLQRPVSYLARSTLFELPVIGWILRSTYVVPIDREAAKGGAIREQVRRMQHGFLVGMFPEGTRTNDGKIGVFRPGFLAIVRRARLPIIPVGIAGGFEAYPRGHLPRPGRVRIVYGEPWQPQEYAEYCERGREADLVAEVKRRVQDCLDEATAWRAGC